MSTFANTSLRIYRLAASGATVVASGTAPAAMDVVLPGNYTSDDQRPLCELLFYDSGSGMLSLYRVGEQAEMDLIKQHQMSKTWDIFVAGNFKGGGLDEVLLYDRTTGASKIIQFSEDGEIVEIARHDFSEKWDVIISGDFEGFAGDDLLFFDRESRHLKIYRCLDGELTKKVVDITLEPGIDHIVAGRFTSSPVGDELFFYNPQTGHGWLFDIVSGSLNLLHTYSTLPKGREVLVSGRLVKGSLPDEILLYDRDTGATTVYGFTHPDLSLEIRMERELPSHAHTVVPCNFVKNAPDSRELLVYGVRSQAVYLGWGAHIDTAVTFDDFFDSDHTVMCWFMPQFVHAYYQPVLAENGSGIYLFGLADYGDGNVVFHKDLGEEFNEAGDPVFFVQIGSERRIYVVPEAREGVWIHMALVREGNTFSLFLNGSRTPPVRIAVAMATVTGEDGNKKDVVAQKPLVRDAELVVSGSTFADKPSGTLRIGRRTSGASTESRYRWQTYGLVDDVAVFSKALGAVDISTIVAKRRLRGDENGLFACWSFDVPGADKGSVFRSWTPSVRSEKQAALKRSAPRVVSVTTGRGSSNDARLFSDPSLIKQCHPVVSLPTKAGEEWKVTQGMNSALESHMGKHAFCYDIVLRDGDTGQTPVFACAPGKVIAYKKDDDGEDPPRESNFVHLKIAFDRVISYLHLGKNSLNSSIDGGTVDPGDPNDSTDDSFVLDDAAAPQLEAGALVGKVGRKAKHLHFGARGTIGPYTAARDAVIPLAFSDFERFDPDANKWIPVEAGFLREKDIFRKPS